MIWYLVYQPGKKKSLLFLYQLLHSRPSTPIEDVLRHSYADKWVENLVNKQADEKKSHSEAKVRELVFCLFY